MDEPALARIIRLCVIALPIALRRAPALRRVASSAPATSPTAARSVRGVPEYP